MSRFSSLSSTTRMTCGAGPSAVAVADAAPAAWSDGLVGGRRRRGPTAHRDAPWPRRCGRDRGRAWRRSLPPPACAGVPSSSARARGSGPRCHGRPRGRAGPPALGEHRVQLAEQLPGVSTKCPERRGQVGLLPRFQLLEQHLGIADDVVQRCAQLMAQLRAGVDAHAPPARPSSASIFCEQAGEIDGLGVEVVAAGGDGLLAVAGHGMRGERDHRDARASPPRP